MKKIVTSMCMLAVVALAFTSCKKNEEPEQALVFNYNTEQLVSDEGSFEKVYLDDHYTVQFEEGDYLQMFNIPEDGNSSAGRYQINNAGQLVGVSGSYINPTTTGNYFSFYPGENVVGLDLVNENRATFRLQSTQVCRVDADGKPMIPFSSLYMAAKDETSTSYSQAHFNFKNICGVLSCKFYSPSGKKIKSISVTDNKFHLTGDVTLKVDKVNPGEMTTLFRNYADTPEWLQALNTYETTVGYSVDNAGSTVTLDCVDPEHGLNCVELGQTRAEATRFFIVLRPLALLNGCHILITFDDDDTAEINSTVNNRISPNVIRNISACNVDEL